jgi:carboxymethylenebutenolidase
MATYQHFVSLPTSGGTMPVFIATPEGRDTPHPTVLVIQGMHGVEPFEIDFAGRLAREGYVAAVPDLFHRRGPAFSEDDLQNRRRSMTDADVIADVEATMNYLRQQPYCASEGFGILGFCMGGRVSYMMAGTSSDIKVAAVFYGGGVFQGEGGPAPIDMTSNIKCPVAVFDGELDHRPTPEDIRNTEAALKQHGIAHEIHMYPGVGHGFMSRRNPDEAHQHAQADGWTQLLRWLEQPLKVGAAAAAR